QACLPRVPRPLSASHEINDSRRLALSRSSKPRATLNNQQDASGMDAIPSDLAVRVARGIPNHGCCTRTACCLSMSCKLSGLGTSLFAGASFAKVVAERESHDASSENSQSVCGQAGTAPRAPSGSDLAQFGRGGLARLQLEHGLRT